MTKNEFLNKLHAELKLNNIDDIEDIINYYEEIIDDKIEQGLSESEALKNYASIDAVIKEIVLENATSKNFTYSDFVQEKRYFTGSLIIPRKQSGVYTSQLEVNNKSNLIVNVWDRKVRLCSSDSIDYLLINYHKKLFNPIEIRTEGNDIKILERSRYSWLSFLLGFMLFIVTYLACLVIVEQFVDKFIWWHYLVAAAISSSAINLVFLLVLLLTKKDKCIEVIVPNKITISSLQTIIKSGRIDIENLVAKNMSLKVVSGKIKLLNSFADDMEIKVSSGSAIIGEEERALPCKINRLNLITSSGRIRVYGVLAKNFTSKTSSGSLRIHNSKFDIVSIKCSSGSVKGSDLTLLDNNIAVSSGSVKLNSLILGNSNLKVSSGTIRFNDIKDVEENFMISGKVASGAIKVNNQRINSVGYKLVTELPKKSLTIRVSSGSVHLNFDKPIF